ncbi:hypothetical protein AYK24_10150 [Thermoplasmatales archaeon SG8-52-4]|nr:MAG: hypothetical protein AYK24_10150 [Thermoplasmatales archaeon SG8-52-4]
MTTPDIVRILREEERLGLLNSKNSISTHLPSDKINKLKEIEFILGLQNGIIEKYLVKIKEGKIKTSNDVVLSLYELKSYYDSLDWKQLSESISIDKLILSYLHLVNSYIEDIEGSLTNKELESNNLQKYSEIKKREFLNKF